MSVFCVTPLLLVAACTAGSPEADITPSAAHSPVQQVDLSALPIARAPFCDRLDETGIEDTLGGPIAGTSHYDNGDEAEITTGLVDVAHEYSCRFDGTPPASARVWIFAAPIDLGRARGLVKEVRSSPGCRYPDGPQFGTPTATTVCDRDEPSPSTVVTFRGLFGDAWLSCEVTLPEGAPGAWRRSRQWCVEVATSLGARP